MDAKNLTLEQKASAGLELTPTERRILWMKNRHRAVQANRHLAACKTLADGLADLSSRRGKRGQKRVPPLSN